MENACSNAVSICDYAGFGFLLLSLQSDDMLHRVTKTHPDPHSTPPTQANLAQLTRWLCEIAARKIRKDSCGHLLAQIPSGCGCDRLVDGNSCGGTVRLGYVFVFI